MCSIKPSWGWVSVEGVLPLVKEYAFAVDLEICIFPQEGMLNNPGTEELMREALRRGGTVVGACPYTDSDPHGQIDRIFALARELDRDIDMHLDFSLDASDMDVNYVCRRAAEHCAAQGVDIAQLALQFSLANDDLATCVVGSANPENVRKWAEWAEAPMDPTLLREVLEILQPIHNWFYAEGRPENNDA